MLSKLWGGIKEAFHVLKYSRRPHKFGSVEVIIMKCCKVPGRVTLAGYMPVNEFAEVITQISVVASIIKKSYFDKI